MRNKENYHQDWSDIIRPAILLRDKFICKVCGVRHKKSYVFQKDGSKFEIPDNEIKEWKAFGDKAYKVFLQVAHLDQDPLNNEEDNLLAMCPKCHLNYDRKFNMLKRKTKYKTICPK